MYPDPQYYYEDDPNSYCPYEGDGSLEQCLRAKEVSISNTEHDDYKECLANFTKRHTKCRDGLRWSEYVLKRHINRTRPIKCDKYNSVYVLNLDESNFRKPYNKCERPFLVQRIANSNLILLVTKSDCEKNMHYDLFNDNPTVIDHYKESMFCYKLRQPLYRRFSKSCFTHHASVSIFNCSILFQILMIIFK